MIYLITGATGLIGKQLIQKLLNSDRNIEIRIVTRKKSTANFDNKVKVFEWDPYNNKLDSNALLHVDTVIHLAGESVAQIRWSKSTKKRILDSRVIVTKFLKERIEEINPNVTFIGASAIGIYGDRANDELDETSSHGDSYLAEVCKLWEQEIFRYNEENSYALRIGIVLSREGGALEQMTPLFKMNLGSPLGSGKQFMSWIHINDLVDMIIYIAENKPASKILNGVSPNPVTNIDFSSTLAKVLNRRLFLKAPSFIIRTVLGEMSSIVLYSQKVKPKILMNEKFDFKYDYLEKALEDIYK